jgi:hypothetical protein
VPAARERPGAETLAEDASEVAFTTHDVLRIELR